MTEILIIVSGALDFYLSNLKGAQRGDLCLNKSSYTFLLFPV